MQNSGGRCENLFGLVIAAVVEVCLVNNNKVNKENYIKLGIYYS